MPQKYNPDVLELVRAKTARVLGQGAAACGILKALPGGYNRDLQETKELYLDALQTTRAALRIMGLLAGSLRIRPERLRAGFTAGVFATDRALELVAAGVPFRSAYQQVREHLDELEASDPDAAVAAKTLTGGTAGLDYGHLFERARAARSSAARRLRASHAAFSKLLGTPWPLSGG